VLSVLTVNIGAASTERARLLLDWLARSPEDVLHPVPGVSRRAQHRARHPRLARNSPDIIQRHLSG
jgi:hypothetical protein